MWHLDDFRRMGYEQYNALPNWRLEELVWQKVWRTQNRWTKEELLDSYKYYLKTCREEGATYSVIEELEKLLKS